MMSYLVGAPLTLDAVPMPLLAAELLKGTVLLLLVFAIAITLRRTAAASRHLLWSLALSAVIALPLISAMIPWRVEVLPARPAVTQPVSAPSSGGDASRIAPQERNATTVPQVDGDERVAGGRSAHGARASSETDARASASETRAFSPAARDASASPLSLIVPPWRPTVPEALLALWLVGVALLLARLMVGVLSVRRLLGRASIVRGGLWAAELRHAANRLGVRRPVQLLRSSEVAMPITCGLLRPRIVLPGVADGWSAERREAVLLHELAHVRRCDVLMHLVARVACALYWFHPLVWAAARRLRAESERACDDRVLRAGTQPSAYAEHLLHIVRAVGRVRAPVAVLPLAQMSEFEGRLIAILEPDRRRHDLRPAHALSITLAVALAALPLAAMGPARAVPAVTAKAAPPSDRTLPSSAATSGRERWSSPNVDGSRTPTDGARARSAASTDGQESAASALPAAAAAEDTTTDDPAAEDAAAGSPLSALASGDAFSAESSRRVSSLIATLRDPHPDVRLAVVEALGQLEDPAAISPLGAMLRDELVTVRAAAAKALGEIADPRAIEALSRALREDPEAEVRKTAAWALGEIDDKRAVPALLTALAKDRDVEVRKTAAWALGEIEDASAVAVLGAALRDESLEVRRTAVWALGEIEDASAVDFLVPALRDSDTEMRRQAAWALGEIESSRAVDALGAAAKDADTKVREQVTWALGEIEDRRALPFLATALRDDEVSVRRKAAWAIGELDDVEVAPPALIEALKDRDREVRKAAAHALGELSDSAAVPGLATLARGDDPELRRTAVWALSEIGGARALEVLVDMLRNDDPEIRKMAAEALGKHR